MIESSIDLQWTRPSYTGGVALAKYTVMWDDTDNMMDMDVEDSSDKVQYSLGLVYGQVLVSAINTCGQESEPAIITIPASGDYITYTAKLYTYD